MKNKQTIIISSIMLVVVLVAVLVGVSAAWFGDLNVKSDVMNVTSDTFGDGSGSSSGTSTIGTSGSAIIISSDTLYPAVMEPGYYTGGKGNVSPSGSALLDPSTSGMETKANDTNIYLDLNIGAWSTEDESYKNYRRVLSTWYIKGAFVYDGTKPNHVSYDVNYLESFNIDYAMVLRNHSEVDDINYSGMTISNNNKPCVVITPITSGDYAGGARIDMYTSPSYEYTLRLHIYFATTDDETPYELLNTTIFFIVTNEAPAK